ncbi:hypothetical protein HYX07_02685 [Candidatus Woesearchaeota archaeon]|nr:hypothetical protein [Candidatus Woesearchaeota archaeon]
MEGSFYLHNSMPSPVEEVEDPPETLHMAWGLWLHHRDALHRLEQRHETNHVLRNARAADDILHYLNYVPKIGHDEHQIEHNEISFDYDYLHEDALYNVEVKKSKNFSIGLKKDLAEILITSELEAWALNKD